MMPDVDTAELRERVASFERWHYSIDLGDGIVTPGTKAGIVNRTEQRRRYFFEPLLGLTGGTLAGLRVLDLASNAGYWSLQAIEAGADFVLGVEGRQMHVDQAKLVFEAKEVDPDRYRFDLGNIFDYPFSEHFDIVLCLGLLYHVSKPMELFEVMANTGAELLVIDTGVTPSRQPVFRLFSEPSSDPRNALDYELVMRPSRSAVVQMAAQFGYRSVALAPNFTDLTGMSGYKTRKRVAFICARTMSLDSLPAEIPPPTLRPGVIGAAARLSERLERRLRRAT